MGLKIIKNIVKNPKSVFGFRNGKKYITLHETDNISKGANADAHARLQQNGFSSSWHYQVDDKQIIQSYDHSAQCYHAGDGRGNGNLNSIGIEICVNSDGDYLKAVENAIWLTKKIMAEENIPIGNVVQHNHWSGKNCPKNLRAGNKGVTWNQFKDRLIIKEVWIKDNIGWKYQNSDGTYPNDQWEKIEGEWYYFNAKGYMETYWVKVKGKYYYLGGNGKMRTGWVKSANKWYYLNSSGAMETGLINVKGKNYYLNSDGSMAADTEIKLKANKSGELSD